MRSNGKLSLGPAFRAVLVGAAALSCMAAQAQIPPEHRTSFSRAKTSVDNAETKLKSGWNVIKAAEQRGDKLMANQLANCVKNVDEATERLDAAKDLIKPISEDVSEVKWLKERIGQVEEDRDKLKDRLGDEGTAVDNGSRDTQEDFEKDKAAVEAFTSLGRDALAILFSETSFTDMARSFPQMKSDLERLAAKYGDSRNNSPEARDMQMKVRRLGQMKKELDSRLERFNAEAEGRVKARLDMAEQQANNAIKEGTFHQFAVTVTPNLTAVGIVLDKLALFNGKSPAWADGAKARVAGLESQMAAQKDKIVASNVVAKEGYTGADKESLRALVKSSWAKAYPDHSILKIVLEDAQWSRTSEWVWSDSAKSWRKIDVSVLRSWIYLKSPDGKYALAIAVYLVKDHMEGGALRANIPFANLNNHPVPRTLLIGKIS